MAFQLVCVKCGKSHNPTEYRIHCDDCNGLLDVKYDTAPTVSARVVPGAKGISRYLPTLPIENPENLITMGEGDTPIIPLPRVGAKLGLNNVQAKLEYFNPTGSFKDRGNAVQVSVLKETGVTEVADGTGGNAGHSFAAYCARAGIRFHGFANDTGATSRKLHAIALHGTEMHWVGSGRSARGEEAKKFSEDTSVLYMNYGQNIYFVEGQKTMAYEIAEQMDPLPDHIIVPIGNGSIYQGLWKGFREMLEDGRVNSIPKLHGAQTEETQPMVAAFEGKEWIPPLEEATSKANGIGVPRQPRPDALLEIVEQSGGHFVAVSESSILTWQRAIAELEGLLIEPTSSIVLGAAQNLRERGIIKEDDRLLLPLTGFGIKEPIPGY